MILKTHQLDRESHYLELHANNLPKNPAKIYSMFTLLYKKIVMQTMEKKRTMQTNSNSSRVRLK